MKTSTGRSVAVVHRERRTVAQRLAHLGIAPVPLRRVAKHPLPPETGELQDATVIKVLALHMVGAKPRSALK